MEQDNGGNKCRCGRVRAVHGVALICNSVHKDTVKLALNVISGAVYGKSFDWDDSEETPPGHYLSFLDSLRLVVDKLLILFLYPKWMLRIPFKPLREARLAHQEFGYYLRELIEAAKASNNHSNSALKALIKHSTEAGEINKKDRRVLNDEELLGNAFIILLGGYETTYVAGESVANHW